MTAWQPVAIWGAGLAQVLDIAGGKLLYGTDTQGIGTSTTSPLGDYNQVQGNGLGKTDAFREVADVLWSASEPGTGYALTSGGLLASPGPDTFQPWTLRCPDTTNIKGNGNTVDAGDAIPQDDKMRPVGRLMVDDSAAPSPGPYLWVGTYSHGIRRSADHGATFSVTANMGGAAPGTNYYCVALAQDPDTPATLYAGTVEHKAAPLGYGGLWRCNTARQATGTPNFAHCTGGGLTPASVWDIKVLGGVIYLACGAGGLWMFDTAQYGDPASATAGWVNLSAGQAWAANKWVTLDVRVTTGTTHQVVAAASLGGAGDSNATAIVSITTAGTPRAVTARAVLCDTNNKAQWATIPPDGKQWWFSATETYGRLGTSGFCNPQIRFDPASGGARIYVVADGGLWRSTDSGATWTISNKGHPGFLGRGPATDPTLPGYLIIGSTDWEWAEATDGGLDGANIRRSSPGNKAQGLATAVDPFDGTVYGTDTGDDQKYSNAGGRCWSHARGSSTWAQAGGAAAFTTATGGNIGLGLCALRQGTGLAYSSADPKVVLAAVQGNTGTNAGGIYRWAAGGSWSRVQAWTSTGSVAYYIPFAHVKGTSDVYAYDPKDTIWHSADFGQTWARRLPGGAALPTTEPHSRAAAAMPGARGEIWVSASKTLYRITGAHTASPAKTPITLPGNRPAGPVGIKPSDGTVYCASLDDGQGCKMWSCTDGTGATWAEVGGDGSFGANNFNPECIVFDGDRVTVTGSNVAVTYVPAPPPSTGITSRQQSASLSGTGSMTAYFGQGGGSANAAGSTLAVKVALDDRSATVTAPAGWELAADSAPKAIPSPSGRSAGAVLPFWIHTSASALDDATIALEAARRGLVVLNAWDTGLLAKFKAANPAIQVYVYKCLSSSRTGDPGAGGEYAAGIGQSYAALNAAHPDWFMGRTGGGQMQWSGFPACYQMDVGNAAYRAAWAAAVLADLQAHGWDGVWADNALVSRTTYGMDPAAYADNAAFQAAYKGMLDAAAAPITAAGKGFIANCSSARLYDGVWASYTEHLTGGFDEHWVVLSSGGGNELSEYGTPSVGLVAQAAEVFGDGGRTAVLQPWSGTGDSDEPQGFRYALAAYYLTSDGLALFSEAPTGGDYTVPPPWRPEYGWDLGDPYGAYTTPATKVYRRDFTAGTVVVNGNASGSPVHVDLGGSFTDMSGATVTSIDLPPLSGHVFRAVAGSWIHQARTQVWLLRNAPAAAVGTTSGAGAVFSCSNASAALKGRIQEWQPPAGNYLYLDRKNGAGAVGSTTSLGPVATQYPVRVTGGLALGFVAVYFTTAPTSGSGFTPPAGWTGDGAASNTALSWHAISQTVPDPAAVESFTDTLALGTGGTMTSWAGVVLTLWASPVQVTTTTLASVPAGQSLSIPLSASGGSPSAATKVGMTVPYSARAYPGQGCASPPYANGLSQQQADWEAMEAVSRGILYSGHRRPPVTKKFWFNGNFNYALSNCDMAGYLAQGTYVMICLYPQTDGVNGDVSPNGVWAAANPGGKYTDSTGVGGASPIRTQALADLASINGFLTDLSAAGWTTDRCEIIFWQEPKNNLTQDQLNVMLRTYGAAVNGPSAPKDPNGDSYKLCLNLNGGGPTTVPTWARVGLGIGTDRWGTGPESTGLPTIDLLGVDWYLGSGGMTCPCEGVEAGTGWTFSKLADTYNGGTNLAINEVGCNPHPDPVPVGSKWDTMADCLQMMGNVHDWIAGRRTAAGGPPRHVNWWTANCYADGQGQLSSPIGLNPNYLAADPRIGAYQSWYDDLSGSGAPVYTWAKWAGSLPPGVTLSPAGVLAGVMSAGSWTFWAQVTDSAGNMAYSQALTLTATSALDITTTTVPPAAASEVYAPVTLQAAGGTGALTWTKTGTLPTGMSLSSSGVLSGTLGAGTAGSYLVTVRATDSLGVYDEIPLTVTVNPALTVTSPAAVTATAGQAAAFLLTAAGGVPPYTWAVSGGTLPTGLYLATDTITGAVSATGNYSWQVQATDPGGGTATLNMTLVVAEPLTVPAALDSLVLAGQFELLAGGVVSDHPACPGAVFRLGRDWEPGMPQPVTDLLAQLGLDGERPMGRRASNRTVTIPITIVAPDRDTLAAAREALWQAVDGQTWELTWARAGGLPLAFDCFRAAATTYVYSVIRDRQLVSTLEVTCQALPYGRSLDLETVVFAAPSAQWGTPANPVTVDDFSAVSSTTQAGQWSQSGQAAAGTHSARWSRRWRDRPCYTHTLASPVNIGNRPKITFWVGLGTSSDQYHVWHGGKITCDITLVDTSGTEIRMAVTRHAGCSGKTDSPAWTRITAAVPLTTLFDGTAVASYSIKIWNTTDHREGDRVLQAEAYLCWLEASAASAGSTQPRGAVYNLRGVIGTARTPLNIQVQPALTAGQTVPANWPKDTPGTYTWAPPAATTATLRATAGGSGGGGGYSSRDRGGGGGAGGEFAMEADWPVTTGQPVTAVVGAAGQAGANGQPGTRGGDTYFMIGGQEVLRAHAGDAGPAGNSGTIARGGTGSRATVHFDGGDGGPPGQLTGSPDGSGGGSAGGWYTAGRAGEEPGREGPGSGGTGVSGGGPGGTGGSQGHDGKAPANGPGGGGGGGDDDAAGGPGWAGRAAISYGVTAGIPIQALIVHQPGPDAPNTLSPLVRVGDGADTPNGNTEYAVPSPVTGLPARFNGTYTVAVGAASFASGSRTLTVVVHQYDEGVTVGGTGTVTGNGRETTVSVARTFAQADAPNGMVVLGEVTLPARDLAPDQMTTAYTVTVTSTNTSDRVNDVMFLDTEGSTVFLNTTDTGFANIWLDSPDPDRALGQVLGSYGGRDIASSILDDAVVSGPPLAAEPGDNWLLVYSPKGAPGAFMTYAACWFLDRLR